MAYQGQFRRGNQQQGSLPQQGTGRAPTAPQVPTMPQGDLGGTPIAGDTGGPRRPEKLPGLPTTGTGGAVGVATNRDGGGDGPDTTANTTWEDLLNRDGGGETGDQDGQTEDQDGQPAWQDQWSQVWEDYQGSLDSQMGVVGAQQSALGRKSAYMSALGAGGGTGLGGAFAGAMAQAGMAGAQLKAEALAKWQRQGLNLRMGYLDRLYQDAQASEDRELQRWIENERNRTEMDIAAVEFGGEYGDDPTEDPGFGAGSSYYADTASGSNNGGGSSNGGTTRRK